MGAAGGLHKYKEQIEKLEMLHSVKRIFYSYSESRFM
jgi:hypothetical protein